MKPLPVSALQVLPRHASAEKTPGHWLLAKMRKRVLRPGGLELTQRLLHHLDIGVSDSVVEFAPDLGVTARLALARNPASFTAIERDRDAAAIVNRYLSGPHQRCVVRTAEETGLADASASVVCGEAMLSMQAANTRSRIVTEAARLLTPGGRCGIHDLCLVPDDIDSQIGDAIAQDLSGEIHAGVRPLTVQQWRELLAAAGLTVVSEQLAPMHLLEPARLARDEGVLRAIRFLWNVVVHGEARRRVLAMRKNFRKYQRYLRALRWWPQNLAGDQQ